MKSAVCTLFEGHFHKGVAGLINSLYKHGFRGDIYIGYRGPLPNWATLASDNENINWKNGKTLGVGEGLQLHFLPVTTHYHLTHYKPTYMLQLLAGPAKNSEALLYFDPDIVNLCKWGFYEKWISHGVAMVHEVVSNDMPVTHPNRMEWYSIMRKIKRKPKRDIHSYINAGFCGISIKNIDFLKVWAEIIETVIKEYNLDPKQMFIWDKTSALYCIDQDSFNIAAMCCESPISEMGPEAMDFIGAGWTMSHATGSPKPWQNKFILSALNGVPPTRPHKNYWDNVSYPLNIHSKFFLNLVKLEIYIAAFIGRFYRRN